MRFLRICTPYRDYLDRFYAERPGLARRPSGDQQRALLADSFQQIDSYGIYLAPLGYECAEVIANARPLQKAWCREHGVTWNRRDYDWHSALAAAIQFQPEVVFLGNARRFSRPWIDALRSACPRLRCVLGWWGVDVPEAESLRGLDVVLTCNRALGESLRGRGSTVQVLPFAFDFRMLTRIDLARVPTIDASFVGSVRVADGFHARRARLLHHLSERCELKVFTPENPESAIWPTAQKFLARCCGIAGRIPFAQSFMTRVPRLKAMVRCQAGFPHTEPQAWCKRARVPVYGLQYYQLLHDSRVSFNAHPECAGAAASNLRLFEATGVGSCLLTDWKDDLQELFEPDREVVCYTTDEECAEKLVWLLEHEEDRARVAAAGQSRTLRQHHFAILAQRLDEIIRRRV
jgi:spore maturation protein CgeB